MKRILFYLSIFITSVSFSQTQFWSDDFEDAGSPSSGSRTFSLAEFYCTSAAYFTRTNGTVPSIASAYTGFTSSKFFAAADIDRSATCSNNSISPGQSITWSSINIAGKSGMSFKGLFGAENAAVFQGLYFADAANSFVMDSMAIEYRIDGGAWQKIISIYPNNGTAAGGKFAVDTDNNRIGDGTPFGNALIEASANISGTGSLLDLRFDIFLNNGAPGSISIDNFRLFETAACTAPTITTQPFTNSDVCAGGTKTISGAATGATTFKWQYNTGSGFTDVPNSAPYSGVSSNTLTITGATAGMSGYLYRLVAINGVASCFTNSSSSTLRVSAINTTSNTQTNVACNGGATGNATVIPSGGISTSYTYSWSPSGGTGATASSLTQGTFVVTVTDAVLTSCTATQSFTITQPTLLDGLTVVTNVSCNNGTNGAINLTPTGGTSGYSFSWGGGVFTEDRTGLSAGTYSVTITDANSCTKTVSGITVTQPTAMSFTASSQTNVSCFGGSNGAASMNVASGGTGTKTYDWTPGTPTGDGTVSVTGLTAGTWTCTVTDVNGCTAAQNFTITAPPAISFTAASQTNVSCSGGSNGAVSMNAATGGAGSYNYDWTPGTPTGDGTISVTGLTAGSWTCTVTDANSCVKSTTFTVTQPPAISFTAASQTNVSCFGGANGAAAMNVATGGAGGNTYDWTPGTPTGDGTTSVTGLTAGSWTCTVTDANGCTANQTFTVTQPPAISFTAASQTNVSCFGGSNGAASMNPATGGAGSYTYDWTPGTPTGDGTTSISGLTAGTYLCTVTDMNGCTAGQNFTLTQPPVLAVTVASQTNVSCNGGSNGSAAINIPTGGTGVYTYDWTPGTPTGDGTTSITGLTAGSWTCTVTDANSCTASQIFTITQPTAIAVTAASQTNIACNGGSNGSASIDIPTGGTGVYTYDWSPGTPTGDGTISVSGLTAGTFTCTVTDANGCTAAQNFTLTAPSVIAVTAASQTNVSCDGGANGLATINTPTGGAGSYTYDWSPGTPTGDGTTSISGLTAGTYTCSVTDANGCEATQDFTLTAASAITVTLNTQTNVSCFGGGNGTVAIDTPIGGTGAFTYDWTPGTPTGDGTTSISGLTAGTYTCNVTDANGCSISTDFAVTEPSELVVNTSTITTLCNGSNDGSATASVSGGTLPYAYSWSPIGGSLATADDLLAGTYTVDITDFNGCLATTSATVNEPAVITGTATISACGSYTWAGQTFTSSGNYTGVFQTADGCDSTVSLQLTIISAPTTTISVDEMGVFTSSTADAYQWINCVNNQEINSETAQSFTPNVNGTYAVIGTYGTCTDTSDCLIISTVGVNELDLISLTIYPNPTTGLVTFSSLSKLVKIEIYDLQGKLLESKVLDGTSIDLSSYERGLYMLNVTDINGVVAIKRIEKIN